MRFQDLCLICEGALKLVAGNFGKPLTAANYDKSIKNNIARSNSSNYASIQYFIGNPSKNDSGFLNLFYIITRTAEALPKSFKYEIPEKTLKRFRNQREYSSSRIKRPRSLYCYVFQKGSYGRT